MTSPTKNVLERIVDDKRIEVASRESMMPLYAIEPGLEPSSRSFYDAIKADKTNNGAGFILEIKKASPSKGLIRADFDLEEICEAYQHYASCVSVLTDEKYFQGDFERLPKVRELLNQPLLCKDFFISPYQVYLARFYGADAVLLMLSVLNDTEYNQLATIAQSLNMDILTEVSNEEEMERAVKLKANIVGINNRNLRDLSTDLNQTPLLVELFNQRADKVQQENTLIISESGIYTHQQVKQLSGVSDGFLVGSSLMAKNDLLKACRDLIVGPIKVCGITTSQDLQMLSELPISYAGLIFVEDSARAVTLDQAKAIVKTVEMGLQTSKNSMPSLVAVTRNLNVEAVANITSALPIAAVQLHGDEDAHYIEQLKSIIDVSSIEIWKAIAVSQNGEFDDVDRLSTLNVDKFVLDTKSKSGESGGTGLTFDWSCLNQFNNNFDIPKIMLAGGLNSENISMAKSVIADGFDLNSGVETSAGIKSKEKIENVLTQLIGRYEA